MFCSGTNNGNHIDHRPCAVECAWNSFSSGFVTGDLSLVLPHRIMVDIKEMLKALDKVTPGIASDETLLYGVEVKFYSNKVVVDKDFETNIHGLRAIGDGASVTRGLQQASANGLSVARSILARMDQK